MTAYDEIPYDCQPIPCTAPEQLAVSSRLHGGPRPPVRDARVLEIGCGDGANLLPLAYHRPGCRFVGIDASRAHIDDARRSAQRLGLANIDLHVGDAARIGNDPGTFDYIMAHGVMSWVPDAVRDGILRMCREKLAPQGLLYLSYNTNPGWLARGLVRDVMLAPAGGGKPLREVLGDALARADALRLPLQGIDHPYAQLLSHELARPHRVNESYLIHDYLAEHNRPYWFREFASLAAGFGFHYLVEAAFTQPDYRVPKELSGCAASLSDDPIEIESLIDVLWYRQHRASLFCRKGEEDPGRGRSLKPGSLIVASGLRAVPGSRPIEADVAVEFTSCLEPDVHLELGDVATRTALMALAPHWPRGLPWSRLLTEVAEMPGGDRSPDLWDSLRELHALGQVDLRLIDLPAHREPGERPEALPLARWEAERRAMVTTSTHHRLGLSEDEREVVRRLDGHHRATDLADSGDCVGRLAAWSLLV